MDDLTPTPHAELDYATNPTEQVELDEGPVLVAVDFSPHSEEALRWAHDYARSAGAPLHILHVVHDPADAPGQYRARDGDALEPMSDIAERRLREFVGRVWASAPEPAGGEPAEIRCISGLPVPRILEWAEKSGARMLVVGHRGHNELKALFIGSTSKRIAHQARVPVTIVRAKTP